MNFLHPGLLAGAALFAVPLIIHLLNRQRFKRRRWAAMEFLLAAYKKQRRRLRQENLLLLLLRCLIPILLALVLVPSVFRWVIGDEKRQCELHRTPMTSTRTEDETRLEEAVVC